MSRGPVDRAPGARRRVAVPQERSVSSLTLLTMVLPILTVGALALVRPHAPEDADHAPRAAALTRAAVVCPGGAGAGPALLAVPDPGAAGELAVRDPALTVRLAPGATAEVERPETFVVQGTGTLAPGLSGVRTGAGSAAACRDPRPETWFTGVGAGAEHRSVLHLVNPDGGAAVADVTVWGEDGEVRADDLRGVLVRGQQETELDLAALLPRRDDLTVRVQVPRGRLAVFLRHGYDELGGTTSDQTWVAAQERPSTGAYLPGVAAGGGLRDLVVGNPGAEQARVQLRLVTPRSEFAPRRSPEIVVPAGSTVTVPLGGVLGTSAAEGTAALRLDSEVPVVATLRSVVGGEVVAVPAAAPVAEETGLVKPDGPATLVLAGAASATEVVVRSRRGDGSELQPQRLRLAPGTSGSVDLPAAARWVSVDPGAAAVHAAVRLGDGPGEVVPLVALTTSRWEPHVSPALY